MTDTAAELRLLRGELAALRADVAALLRAQRRPHAIWTDERIAELFRRVWSAHGTAAWSVRSLHELGLIEDGAGKPLGYALAGLRDAGGSLSAWQLRALGRSKDGQTWQLQAVAEGDEAPLLPVPGWPMLGASC